MWQIHLTVARAAARLPRLPSRCAPLPGLSCLHTRTDHRHPTRNRPRLLPALPHHPDCFDWIATNASGPGSECLSNARCWRPRSASARGRRPCGSPTTRSRPAKARAIARTRVSLRTLHARGTPWGECLLDGALRRLVIQNEGQALGEDAVKYSLLTPTELRRGRSGGRRRAKSGPIT